MRVREVHFNHDPTSHGSDAIGLRYDADTLITAPEWTEGEPPKPAAYVRSAQPITVKVKFGGGPPNGTVQIGAIASLDNPRSVPGITSGSNGPGGLKPQAVDFDGAGDSRLIAFHASGDMRNVPVGAYGLRFTWQLKHESEFVEFANTRHLIYVTLAPPTKPWAIAVGAAQFFPWEKALAKACDWAAGATTVDDAIVKIATALNSIPKQTYDRGAHQFVREDGVYDLSFYLHELDYASTFTINCRGLTAALTTFANLMGATLCPLYFENTVGRFCTNPVQLLADTSFSVGDWGWHEIALKLPFLIQDPAGGYVPASLSPTLSAGVPLPLAEVQLIYDALVHFDDNPPLFPMKMNFGTVGNGFIPGYGYRHRLVATGTADVVIPMLPRTLV